MWLPLVSVFLTCLLLEPRKFRIWCFGESCPTSGLNATCSKGDENHTSLTPSPADTVHLRADNDVRERYPHLGLFLVSVADNGFLNLGRGYNVRHNRPCPPHLLLPQAQSSYLPAPCPPPRDLPEELFLHGHKLRGQPARKSQPAEG